MMPFPFIASLPTPRNLQNRKALAELDRVVARETGLPIHVDSDPLTCVVRGAGKVLAEWDQYQGVVTT